MPARLEAHRVTKRFGATVALQEASLAVQPGEIHALIGENGAGKSTLMKILSGVQRADGGDILLDGAAYAPAGPLAARRSGVAMIYQELTLAADLSVAENILLGQEAQQCGWIDSQKTRHLARTALARLGAEDLPLGALARTLTVAQQQLVEIARALVGQAKVLIMDEPTSSLTQADTQRLFAVIRDLQASGVSIIYISHFLEECQALCDRYTVLRDGRTVASGAMQEAKLNDLIRAMVGREMAEIYPARARSLGKSVLELRSLAGQGKPAGVDLTLRAGEIFGLAGLVGAGRTETLRATFGLDRLRGGEIILRGQRDRGASPATRLRAGMGLLSEDRKEEGLLLNRALAENLLLSRYQSVSHWGLISRRQERAVSRQWIEALEVKTRGPDQPVGQLSGGNQQKVALARLLHHGAEVLLLDEPTRGIDVGSKQQIYRLMADLATRGKAILFVSSYLPELLGVCDTIGVMCRGRLVATRPASRWTEQEIMRYATGAQTPAA